MHAKVGEEIDLLLADALEEGLLGAPMEQEVLHLMRRVDALLLLGRHEAGTDAQHAIGPILYVDAGGRRAQDGRRIAAGVRDADPKRAIHQVRGSGGVVSDARLLADELLQKDTAGQVLAPTALCRHPPQEIGLLLGAVEQGQQLLVNS